MGRADFNYERSPNDQGLGCVDLAGVDIPFGDLSNGAVDFGLGMEMTVLGISGVVFIFSCHYRGHRCRLTPAAPPKLEAPSTQPWRSMSSNTGVV